ncbi:MAG: MFS transporter [Chloroflexota bacterium]|nr:MFS transporter [Chloroflexota bacterium]MDE2884321.1 MFS transporter [Chloroflexota bacterium]
MQETEGYRAPTRRRKRWYYGWTIVAVLSVISFAGGVETNPVLGVFQGPMTEEFGWTRFIYTMPMSIGSFMGGIASLIVGPLMDRYGSRIIMTVAVALMGLTFVLMGAVQELWHHFALQILGRTVIASTFFMVIGVVIPKWFIVMRGRAGALANLGQRLGQIGFPIMVERILTFGTWRSAWVAMGVTVWASSLLPALLFLRRTPEDHGLLPDGVDIRDASQRRRVAAVQAEVSFDRRMALRTPAFYLIAGAVSIQSFVTTSIHFHWFSYLTDLRGESGEQLISSAVAVASVSLSPLISMPVSIAAGVAAERWPVQRLMAFSYFFMALSIVVFLFTDTALLSYVFGLLFGASTGILFTVMNIIWADYFGRDSIGGIRGMVSPVHMLCNSLGPLTAAWSFDVTGSYFLIFVISAVLSGVGGTLVLLARRPLLTDR